MTPLGNCRLTDRVLVAEEADFVDRLTLRTSVEPFDADEVLGVVSVLVDSLLVLQSELKDVEAGTLTIWGWKHEVGGRLGLRRNDAETHIADLWDFHPDSVVWFQQLQCPGEPTPSAGADESILDCFFPRAVAAE